MGIKLGLFLIFRNEHRLMVIENRSLKRIFGPKRDEVTGEWRKLHSEKLHILYSSTNVIRQNKSWRMEWAEHGRGEKSDQGFGGKVHGKETNQKSEA
jgi:hypothetical protein